MWTVEGLKKRAQANRENRFDPLLTGSFIRLRPFSPVFKKTCTVGQVSLAQIDHPMRMK